MNRSLQPRQDLYRQDRAGLRLVSAIISARTGFPWLRRPSSSSSNVRSGFTSRSRGGAFCLLPAWIVPAALGRVGAYGSCRDRISYGRSNLLSCPDTTQGHSPNGPRYTNALDRVSPCLLHAVYPVGDRALFAVGFIKHLAYPLGI